MPKAILVQYALYPTTKQPRVYKNNLPYCISRFAIATELVRSDHDRTCDRTKFIAIGQLFRDEKRILIRLFFDRDRSQSNYSSQERHTHFLQYIAFQRLDKIYTKICCV